MLNPKMHSLGLFIDCRAFWSESKPLWYVVDAEMNYIEIDLSAKYKNRSTALGQLGSQVSNVHCKPIPVMKTGFSLCSFSHREKPGFINSVPCNENRFSLCGKTKQGKPCSGPVLALYGIAVSHEVFTVKLYLGIKNLHTIYLIIDYQIWQSNMVFRSDFKTYFGFDKIFGTDFKKSFVSPLFLIFKLTSSKDK